MSLEYAPRGLVGMLTPQANTTVEPEFNLLWPPGVAMINARLMSDKATMSARLVDYFENYGAVAAAIRQRADRRRRRGLHRRVVSGRARARGSARGGDCGAARFSLLHGGARGGRCADGDERAASAWCRPIRTISTSASVAYWQSHGFEVAEVASAFNAESAFHPIYSLDGSAAAQALRSLEDKPLDAIVMLGTGMPTLRADRRHDRLGRRAGDVVQSVPRLARGRGVRPPGDRAATLQPWLRGEGWVGRLKAQMMR